MTSRATITLKASEEGKGRIQQARRVKGWIIDDPQWLVAASEVLKPEIDFKKSGVFADGASFPTWRRFLAGKAIRQESFKAFCQVLELDYKEIVDWKGIDEDTENYSDNLYIERQKPEYFPLIFDFQLGDSTVFNNLEKFCKWFCVTVSNELELENKLTEYWEKVGSCNQNTTAYFQKYLLQEINTPKVLILDNVDLVFEHQEIATDFCNLLRSWHEKAKAGNRANRNWQKLRLIIVHSTDVYGSININCSSLTNVGTLVELQEFTKEQVQKLVDKYSLNLENKEFEELMKLIKGNPYLVDLALKKASTGTPLTQLLETAATDEGIYSEHLRCILRRIQQNSELVAALKEVVNSPEPVGLETVTAFKLQSMGLIKLSGDLATSRCQLYRRYFQNRLGNS